MAAPLAIASQDVPPTYDFTPFLSCPAVISQAFHGQINLVSIPVTKIPSPLAEDIAPQTILDLEKGLCGEESDGTGAPLPGFEFGLGNNGKGNGREVWLSWKRAWDLWNNHYIEGRVDENWVGEEYERIKKGLKPSDGQKVLERPRNFPVRAYDDDEDDDDGDVDGDEELVDARIETSKDVAVTKKGRVMTVESHYDLPPAISGFVWRKTNKSSYVPSRHTFMTQTVTEKDASLGPGIKTRRDMILNMPVRRGQLISIFDVQEQFREVEEERIVRAKPYFPISSWADDVKHRQNSTTRDAIKNQPIRSRLEPMDVKKVKVKVRRRRMKQGVVEYVPEGLQNPISWQDLRIQATEAEVREQWPEPKLTGNIVRKRMMVPDYRFVYTGQEVITEDGFRPGPGEELYFADDQEDEFDLSETFVEEWEEVSLPPKQTVRFNETSKHDERPAEALLVRDQEHEVDQDDATSGGFLAMKDFPEYMVTQYGEEPLRRDDLIQNSVWRPRRVGEKSSKIDGDEDVDEVSEFDIDGGVDCGRSPYPVLRAKMMYSRHSVDGESYDEIKKWKVWDEVTSTIFNMPIEPLEPEPESKDPKLLRTKPAYSENYQNSENERDNSDIFPLDIRRVLRVDPKTGRPPQVQPIHALMPPVNSSPELELEHLRDMEQCDPWWVTEKQRKSRDEPARRYPPAWNDKDTKLLPVDRSMWYEQVELDKSYGAAYFVTNLNGGTLIINGIQVLKGCVAGPLPPFAIIESPGGQVSFWWGVNGRNWGAGPPDLAAQSGAHWATLRRMPGWEHIGMQPAQIWDPIIRDRLKRERTGNTYPDDDIWEKRHALASATKDNSVDLTIDLPETDSPFLFWDGDFNKPANAFETPKDELKWAFIATRAYDVAPETVVKYPTRENFWQGTRERITAVKTEQAIEAERSWYNLEDKYVSQQRLRAKIQKQANWAKTKAKKAQRSPGSGKRDAADLLKGSTTKKVRIRGGSAVPDAGYHTLENVGYDGEVFEAARVLRQQDLAGMAAKRREDQLIEEAYVASLLKDKPESQHRSIKRHREFCLKAKAESDEAIRVEGNKIRASRGDPLIPPQNGYDVPALEEYIKRARDAKTNKGERSNTKRSFEAEEDLEEQEERKRSRQARIHAKGLELAAKRHRNEILQKRNDDEAKAKSKQEAKAMKEKAAANILSGQTRYTEFLKRTSGQQAAKNQAQSVVKQSAQRPKRQARAPNKSNWDLLAEQNDMELQATLERSYALNRENSNKRVSQQNGSSETYQDRYADQRASFNARAAEAHSDPYTYAIAAGYKDVEDAVHREMTATHVRWGTSEDTDVLHETQSSFRAALEQGLRVRAARAGKTQLEFVQELAGAKISVNRFIDDQVNTITPKDIPKALPVWPSLPNAETATAEETRHMRVRQVAARKIIDNARKKNLMLWRKVNERIHKAAAWDVVIDKMPDPKNPPRPSIDEAGRRHLEF